ncbi:RT0821/Lpp0805 family surface protein [Allorhizobium sp. BGMRC 0089]|uniref:RT0821/Lpp0805 family surface protein n=1 Tax=Allorhizobium sonneratiae TaxID=2934936 RepID=UPI002033B9E7|nr:RT0821/Lpp0805 family surface protein [Allorhizobium sonneratiae]MCM2294522.1 RT0821/Lpp0805 family surface protein [Allorhizobium sonneratiae]
MAKGLCRLAAVAAVSLALGGCVSNTMDVADSAGVDRSIATGTIPVQPEKKSDQDTVRNAVSSADVSKTGQSPIPWANAATGSAGVITSLSEERTNGVVCRDFVTSRHAYDGIANFYGRACMVGDGQWQMVNFTQQS